MTVEITKRKLKVNTKKEGTVFTFTIVANLNGDKECRMYDLLKDCDTKGILKLLAED